MRDDDLRVKDMCSFHSAVEHSQNDLALGPDISDVHLRQESGLGLTLPLL